jgi:hypothetical protein
MPIQLTDADFAVLEATKQLILAAPAGDRYGRLLSWSHCYDFFFTNRHDLMLEKDHAALHLGFYLGNWGMFRNSELLNRNHTFYHGIVEILASAEAQTLHTLARLQDANQPAVANAARMIRTVAARLTIALEDGGITPTPTLVSKILLATTGCIPAFDLQAKATLRSMELRVPVDPFSERNNFLERLINYAMPYRQQLTEGMPANHPPMQVFDLYLWSRNAPA